MDYVGAGKLFLTLYIIISINLVVGQDQPGAVYDESPCGTIRGVHDNGTK